MKIGKSSSPADEDIGLLVSGRQGSDQRQRLDQERFRLGVLLKIAGGLARIHQSYGGGCCGGRFLGQSITLRQCLKRLTVLPLTHQKVAKLDQDRCLSGTVVLFFCYLKGIIEVLLGRLKLTGLKIHRAQSSQGHPQSLSIARHPDNRDSQFQRLEGFSRVPKACIRLSQGKQHITTLQRLVGLRIRICSAIQRESGRLKLPLDQ